MKTRLRRGWMFMLLIVLTTAMMHTSYSAGAATTVVFTSVTPDLVPLGSDYALDVRDYGWDFNTTYHYASELTAPSFVNGGQVLNGWFEGTTNTADPKIWLQDLTIPGKVPTQNEGFFHPIDTSVYRYLTFRMCSDQSSAALVFWHQSRDINPNTVGGAGFKTIKQGCHVYSFDLVADRNTGAGNLAWTDGPIQSIAIRPTTEANVNLQLDYVRLSATSPSAGPIVTITWSPTRAPFDMYFDTDPAGNHATLIESNIDGSSGQYRWTTPNLYPGMYYIITKEGAQQSVSSPFVVNAPPTAQVTAPGYTSGPDYATTVVGNPWDMSDTADARTLFASGTVFDNGILRATSLNGNGDPGILLNTPVPIDPTQFYYATYRMRVLGTQDIGLGSVARLFWWTDPNNIPGTASVTQDIVVYEGWRTVSVDLRTVPLEPKQQPWLNGQPKAGFRLDPHEFSTPHTFEIDDVKLTGNDRASTAFDIQYDATDVNNQPITKQFFYSAKADGTNPTRLICKNQSVPPGPNPTGPNLLYLPLVIGGAGRSATGCLWDVANLPNGDYYIVMTASDGVDTVTRVSATPLEVRH